MIIFNVMFCFNDNFTEKFIIIIEVRSKFIEKFKN
jgi:hypothetical protein